MNSYLDTSALVKLVIDERGSDTVAELWMTADDPNVSMLAYAEMRAAIAAAARAGRLSGPRVDAARQAAETAWGRVVVVEVGDALARAAGDLADRHGLRAADAIHLASAIRIREADTVFVSFDRRLREAAAAEGFLVLPETV